MTDDLVKRLRLPWPKDGSGDEVTLPLWVLILTAEAADRIDELEVSLQAVLNREAATTARYDAKTDELEAKLAKALAGLDKAAALIEDRHVVHMTSKGRNPKDYISEWSLIAKEVRAIIAEIEGEKT
jgi:hypothetical protein